MTFQLIPPASCSFRAGEFALTLPQLPKPVLFPKTEQHSTAGYPAAHKLAQAPCAQVAYGFSCRGQILLSITRQSPMNASEPSFSAGKVGHHCFGAALYAVGQEEIHTDR